MNSVFCENRVRWAVHVLAWNSILFSTEKVIMISDRYVRTPMRIRYTFEKLTREQRAALEAVLLEEMEIQAWYTVTVSSFLGGETLIWIQ